MIFPFYLYESEAYEGDVVKCVCVWTPQQLESLGESWVRDPKDVRLKKRRNRASGNN